MSQIQGMFLATLYAALYVSEGWYENWCWTGRPHSRARAVVLFDRVLNQETRE